MFNILFQYHTANTKKPFTQLQNVPDLAGTFIDNGIPAKSAPRAVQAVPYSAPFMLFRMYKPAFSAPRTDHPRQHATVRPPKMNKHYYSSHKNALFFPRRLNTNQILKPKNNSILFMHFIFYFEKIHQTTSKPSKGTLFQ
jgi:hypothetical protein